MFKYLFSSLILVSVLLTVIVFFNQKQHYLPADNADGVVLILNNSESADTSQTNSIGTGFFIADNLIVTNAHVVMGADSLSIRGIDSHALFDATVIATNYSTDIALVEIDAWEEYKQYNSVSILEFADSRDLKLGDSVWSIGHPWGLSWTVTQGIVSSQYRRIDNSMFYYIQTDAAIHQGNSGGPLLDQYGRVVGINSRILSPSFTGSFGIAIPSEIAINVIESLKETGGFYIPTIGLSLELLNDNTQVQVSGVLDWPSTNSVDIQQGDILLNIVTSRTDNNGIEIRTLEDFANELVVTVPGETITLTLLRDLTQVTVDIVTDSIPIF